MFDFIQLFAQLRNYNIIQQSQNKTICFDTKKKIYIQIFICEDSKLDMNYFYKAYEHLETYNANSDQPVHHLIFIYRVATIQIKKLKMYKDVLCIEFFQENEIRRLLIGNRFIPKHSKVEDQKEYQDIVNKFGKDHLPTILHTDPIVRLYNFEINSIIQIERSDVIYYRLVIPDD